MKLNEVQCLVSIFQEAVWEFLDYISIFLKVFRGKKLGNQVNHLLVDQKSNSRCPELTTGLLNDV
jgi:hypothetical protein